MKLSIKNFNSDVVASFETKMRQAYFNYNFFSLFILLIKLAKSQFPGVSYFQSLRAAYHLAFAAALFRTEKGKENKELILKKMTSFFKVIHNNSLEDFDYKKAARLELNWWLVDRYPDRYDMTREEAMALAMSQIYNISPDKLKDYARYRAEAELINDRAEAQNNEVDWQEVESALKKSYSSLYNAVNK